MLTSSLLGIGWPPAAPHQSWDRPCCGSATRRLRRPRRIGVIGTGLDSRRALRIAATGMHDYSWRVAFVLSGGAAPRRGVAVTGRFAACRSAVPSLSGRSEWLAPAAGRVDLRRVIVCR